MRIVLLSGCIRYLEEVLHSLRIITVTLPTDSLDLFDLSGLTRGLNVLEVNILVLTEVHDRAKEVEET